MKKLPIFEATATLIGTVIGAGILGIPYAVSKVGFIPGILIMIGIALIIMVGQLMLAEVCLRTPVIHQIPGYTGRYLGTAAKRITFVVTIMGGYGALLAYVIGEGEVLQALLGGSSMVWSLAFFAVASLMVYFGINVVKRSELVMTVFIFLITLSIGVYAWNQIEFAHLMFWQPKNWVLLYGVLLFAFSGSVAIPEMREILKHRERMFVRAIIGANVLIFIVYALFTYLVLGVTGSATTEIATVGLGAHIGPRMIIIGNLLAFFTMGTSFLTSALGLRDMFRFDYRVKTFPAWMYAVIAPLVIFVLGIRDFITVLGVVGGVLVSIQTIILVLTYWKARKTKAREPEFSLGSMYVIGALLIICFAVGGVMTILNI